MDIGNAKGNVEMDAIVFPPCSVCNSPYAPSRPIENYGTVFFKSPDRIANGLFKVEQFIQRLRRMRMRKR